MSPYRNVANKASATTDPLAIIRAGARSADGLLNANSRDIAAAIDGFTGQSTAIAKTIRKGDLKVSILGDDLFERALAGR